MRVELGEHLAQRALAHRLEGQLVAEALELAVVVDRQPEHGACLVQLAGRVADVAHAVDRAGAAPARGARCCCTPPAPGVAMARIAPVPVCHAESTT